MKRTLRINVVRVNFKLTLLTSLFTWYSFNLNWFEILPTFKSRLEYVNCLLQYFDKEHVLRVSFFSIFCCHSAEPLSTSFPSQYSSFQDALDIYRNLDSWLSGCRDFSGLHEDLTSRDFLDDCWQKDLRRRGSGNICKFCCGSFGIQLGLAI